MSHGDVDRLFDLLPALYRVRDAEQGHPLRALLRVIEEQVAVLEGDLDRLYAYWFVETCDDWAVPYVGELVGYRPAPEAGTPALPDSPSARRRNQALVPRRDVANTIGHRRRKGSAALLEDVAADTAGWPARAVEGFRVTAGTAAANHVRLDRGRTVDLRDGGSLRDLDGPFDRLAHTVDVRRPPSTRRRGLHNLPSVALWLWRLRPYALTRTAAHLVEEAGTHCFTFSALGNDAPLFTRPEPESAPWTVAERLHVPEPVTRAAFGRRPADYYGEGRSFLVRVGSDQRPVAVDDVVVADLRRWQYRPRRGQVAIDPERGRLAFAPNDSLHRRGVSVDYVYGLAGDLGGGPYGRPLRQRRDAVVYRVGRGAPYADLRTALDAWRQEAPQHAVVEVVDDGLYVEAVVVELAAGQSFQLRAAERARPVLRLLDWQGDRPDALTVTGEAGSRFVLDGMTLTGRGVSFSGELAAAEIRHCTLVPGWGLGRNCDPTHPGEPSVEVWDSVGCLEVTSSICGPVRVVSDVDPGRAPLCVRLADSVLDATGEHRVALAAPDGSLAHATLTIERSTVVGEVQAYAAELVEDSILLGEVCIGRRRLGCFRYSFVDTDCRTPRRYACQPELVRRAAPDPEAAAREARRVRPRLTSLRYGMPGYAQLAWDCAEEITRGAHDESEMGAFHDLFQPQRGAVLRTRLDEFTVAGMDAGVVHRT